MRGRTVALTALLLSVVWLAPSHAVATKAGGSTAVGTRLVASRIATVAPSRMRAVMQVATKRRVVFVTVDDGVVLDRAFLRLVRDRHLPVSVFLTVSYARGHRAEYFRRLQRAGARIEDHTITHPDLRRVGDQQLHREICTAALREKHLFGRSPTLFRAPYGALDQRVVRTARRCGMTTVGWDAVMPARGGLETWNGHGRLNRGDIVLLHFVRGLAGQVERVLAEAARRHLTVALLEDYVHAPR
jgi:peptidoglycan/xylan/chitin deacetylase (PgdA/CDA1 family)